MDQANLEHWEQLAALHGTGPDRYYDLESLIEGATLMGDEEAAALARAAGPGGLAGLDIMHLQCHIGCDAITMARQGAKVTGVDFSPTALARLRELSIRCGVEVSTVEADSRDLPSDLEHSFDIVYATIGVLCWIDDIDEWMRGVARVLRPGGTLVLVELHPVLTMIDEIDPLVLNFPYLFDGGHSFSGTGSYANRDADVAWTTVQYAHGLAEVLMAAHGAGLATTYLEEHTSMSFDPRGMVGDGLDADGRYRLRIGLGARQGDSGASIAELPVLYTLLASSESPGAE